MTKCSMLHAILVLAVLLVPFTTHAEVMKVSITSRTDLLGGRSFGPAGAYEKIQGTIHFAVSPEHPRNRGIVDIDHAPRNGLGLVDFG